MHIVGRNLASVRKDSLARHGTMKNPRPAVRVDVSSSIFDTCFDTQYLTGPDVCLWCLVQRPRATFFLFSPRPLSTACPISSSSASDWMHREKGQRKRRKNRVCEVRGERVWTPSRSFRVEQGLKVIESAIGSKVKMVTSTIFFRDGSSRTFIIFWFYYKAIYVDFN